jgi:hypothetical protein
MEPVKNNAGNRSRDTGTAKGFQSFGDNYTESILEIAKELKEQRLRRDNAALRLPPLHCGCRDPLRCRCARAGAA